MIVFVTGLNSNAKYLHSKTVNYFIYKNIPAKLTRNCKLPDHIITVYARV